MKLEDTDQTHDRDNVIVLACWAKAMHLSAVCDAGCNGWRLN